MALPAGATVAEPEIICQVKAGAFVAAAGVMAVITWPMERFAVPVFLMTKSFVAEVPRAMVPKFSVLLRACSAVPMNTEISGAAVEAVAEPVSVML